jgi:hypothetical protein
MTAFCLDTASFALTAWTRLNTLASKQRTARVGLSHVLNDFLLGHRVRVHAVSTLDRRQNHACLDILDNTRRVSRHVSVQAASNIPTNSKAGPRECLSGGRPLQNLLRDQRLAEGLSGR